MALQRFAAFVRGISPMNAKMPELARCFQDAGFEEVRTLLSSGNVVFSSRPASEAILERTAEEAMQKRLGRTFMTIVRSQDALQKILDHDPFAPFRLPPDAKRVITFLRQTTAPKVHLPIEQDGVRILHLEKRAVFTAYLPNPRGPVFMTLLEKTFGTEVTTRTWDTVRKAASLAPP